MTAISNAFFKGLIPILADRAPSFSAAFIIAGLILSSLIAYLLGSLNFALILSKKMYGEDIRSYGSKNAGTTNMMRTYGKKAAILTILGDILKGIFAVIIGSFIMGYGLGGSTAGLFCVIGHVFPLFYGFRGGKGVATSAAVILVLNPTVFLIMISVFLITVILTRYISLGSCLAAALFPFLTYHNRLAVEPEERLPYAGIAFLCSFVMAILVICKHHENLRRLANGRESKFSFKKSRPAGESEVQKEEPAKYKAKKKSKNTKYTIKKK